jgi:hypothetical protein
LLCWFAWFAYLNLLDEAATSLAGGRGGGADEVLCDVEAAESPVAVTAKWVARRRLCSMWRRRRGGVAGCCRRYLGQLLIIGLG